MSQAEQNGDGIQNHAGLYIHRPSGQFLEAVTPIQGDAFVRLGYELATDADIAASKTDEPKSLKGLTKAQLLAVAEEEGVDVDSEATNAEITEAIEQKREGE